MAQGLNTVLTSYVDPETGLNVELCRYTDGTKAITGKDDFWFAYPGNVMDGAAGDTPEEAIAKALAKRRAA